MELELLPCCQLIGVAHYHRGPLNYGTTNMQWRGEQARMQGLLVA